MDKVLSRPEENDDFESSRARLWGLVNSVELLRKERTKPWVKVGVLCGERDGC